MVKANLVDNNDYVRPLKGGLSARDIPLEKVTIARLQTIFKTVIRVNECRLRLNPHHTGYTYINIGGIKYPAHRVVKTAAMGKNMRGLVVDHLCRNRSCVRLSHLEFVTTSENVKRGTSYLHWLDKRHTTHCKWGHAFTPENTRTFIRTDTRPGNQRRSCRKCHALTEKRRRADAKKAE